MKKLLVFLVSVGMSLSFSENNYGDVQCVDGGFSIEASESNLRQLTSNLNSYIPSEAGFRFDYNDLALYAYVCMTAERSNAMLPILYEMNKLFEYASTGGIVYESGCSECFGVCEIESRNLFQYLVNEDLDALIIKSGQPLNEKTREFFREIYNEESFMRLFVAQGDSVFRADVDQYFNAKNARIRALPSEEKLCEALDGRYVEFEQGRCYDGEDD